MRKDKACGKKRQYSNEQEAVNAAFVINTRLQDSQGCYRCPFCKFWHTGHMHGSGLALIRKYSVVVPADQASPVEYPKRTDRSIKHLTNIELLVKLKTLHEEIKVVDKSNQGPIRSAIISIQDLMKIRCVSIPEELEIVKAQQYFDGSWKTPVAPRWTDNEAEWEKWHQASFAKLS